MVSGSIFPLLTTRWYQCHILYTVIIVRFFLLLFIMLEIYNTESHLLILPLLCKLITSKFVMKKAKTRDIF